MTDWELEQTYPFRQGIVRYQIIGNGPPLVLVHGTPWSSFTWHRLAPVLAKRYRVHYFDLIGFGQSEQKDGQDVSLAGQSRLLTDLLNHWDLKDPTVIAHDIGGAVSLRSHLLDGSDYKKLMLINVVALAPWGSPFFKHIQQHEKVFSSVPAYIHKAIVEAYIKSALHCELDPNEFEALVSPWLDQAGQPAFYRQIAQASQLHTDEIEPLYGKIRCPVQILWGEKDNWIPIATGERLHQAITGSNFHAVPEAGHLSQLDAAEFVESRVLEFLDTP